MRKDVKLAIFRDALKEYGPTEVPRKNLNEIAERHGYRLYNSTIDEYRVRRGYYSIPAAMSALGEPVTEERTAEVRGESSAPAAETPAAETPATETPVPAAAATFSLVPEKSTTFVKTPNYRTVEKVVKSETFFPVFLTGPSGNGKSLSVVEAAARTNRELFRINVTAGTEESDLIGNWSLVDGNTVWMDGPVIAAMRKGALLLIDEIDMLNPNKAASLFTALEGKGVYIKKTNEFVRPADGFNIFATANTKGKGSDDGRFMGTNILNEAFLERFPIMIENDYPTKTSELKMVTKAARAAGIEDEETIESFSKSLVDWAAIIRKGFNEGSVEETMSTRRLVHIVKAYSIFEDRLTAVKMATARFDDEIKESFLDLYTKIDAGAIVADEEGNEISTSDNSNTTEEPAF